MPWSGHSDGVDVMDRYDCALVRVSGDLATARVMLLPVYRVVDCNCAARDSFSDLRSHHSIVLLVHRNIGRGTPETMNLLSRIYIFDRGINQTS